ncbi:glutaminase family protein [Echinicola pacifica]|nr:glutaminase family protein [Echinicola pacifica]
MMNNLLKYTLLFPLYLAGISCQAQSTKIHQEDEMSIRPPAFPLITVDPYLSIWSMDDQLAGSATKHWTGLPNQLQGLVRVDGKSYYFLGKEMTETSTLLPMSGMEGQWKYTYSQPNDSWMQEEFVEGVNWHTTKGAFTNGEDSPAPNKWTTKDIWVRRTFELDRTDFNDLLLNIHHDDNVEVFINGIKAYEKIGWVNAPIQITLPEEVKESLHKGTNVLAIHCENTRGGAFLDAGILEVIPSSVRIDTAEQISASVSATSTDYFFHAGPVALKVKFTSPMLPDDLEVFSRPANYISFSANSLDTQLHEVQVYLSASSDLAVNTTDQMVGGERLEIEGLTALRLGTVTQPVLQKKGDNIRIDWGYMYLTASDQHSISSTINFNQLSILDFVNHGKLTVEGALPDASAPVQGMITAAMALDFGKVGKKETTDFVTLAYDDIYSVQFFSVNLKAWWKKYGKSTAEMLQAARSDYESIMRAAKQFDERLYKDAKAAAGVEYAEICALVYRQAIAAHKAVEGPDGELYFFSKENFSNGSIGTVDISYPSAPLFLLYNPDLLKGMLDPIFYYSESGKWAKPFPAHDIGTYPLANGQTYGEDMPVEEAGNMILLTTAISKVEGTADYASQHWEVLTTWVEYLAKEGFDPANQLCTDDFAGHLAHNTNLSVKAILAIAGYGQMAQSLGKTAEAEKYTLLAKDFAQKWMDKAIDGDHYSLTFDQKGSWSQKYNLVWNNLLGLDIFPDEVAHQEVLYYLSKQEAFGLPLDSRKTYTKSDWVFWTASLAKSDHDKQALIAPMIDYINNTPDRIPVSDWHETTTAESVGFRARSVVGGYFMPVLKDYFLNK